LNIRSNIRFLHESLLKFLKELNSMKNSGGHGSRFILLKIGLQIPKPGGV